MPCMSSSRSPATPKGVPSKAYFKFGFGELAKQLGILPRGPSKKLGLGRAVGVDADKELPHFCSWLPEIGESDIFMWRAPHGEVGEVQVPASEVVQLAGPQHEVKGEARCGGEVLVQRVEERQVAGVVPKLTGRGS